MSNRHSSQDGLASPHDLEEYETFVSRYSSYPSVKRVYPSPIKRRQLADVQWQAAKIRSLVSIKHSGGEWLLFD